MSARQSAAPGGMVPMPLAGAFDRADGRLVTPLGAVVALTEARAELDAWIAAEVNRARTLGTSWAELGAAVGITGEGARLRWGTR